MHVEIYYGISLLASLSRLLQPARILEVGTFTGYSALCMAEGLRRGGGIVTLERDAKAARIALKHFAVSDYNVRCLIEFNVVLYSHEDFLQIELMHGSALDSLLSLKQSMKMKCVHEYPFCK